MHSMPLSPVHWNSTQCVEGVRPTWVWGRRCWARRGTSWWFPRLWTSCASSPAAPWGTHYWDVSTAVRWTCSGSCHGKDVRRVRLPTEPHSNSPNRIQKDYRQQLNVHASCIYLSDLKIMTFDLFLFFLMLNICPYNMWLPRKETKMTFIHVSYPFNFQWQDLLFKLQAQAEALFVWRLEHLHRRL